MLKVLLIGAGFLFFAIGGFITAVCIGIHSTTNYD